MFLNKKTICISVIISLLFCGCTKTQTENVKTVKSGAPITLQMQNPSTLDPLKSNSESVRNILSLCYEPLFRLDNGFNLDGVLAESLDISDDCESAVVHLKKDVKWHNGKKFTAEDVKYTIDKIKEEKNSPYSDCVRYIESTEAVSSASVKLELTRPYSQIGYSLYFPIIQRDYEKAGEKINGTGAYVMKTFTSNVSLELEKNKSWHMSDVITKKIHVSIMRDDDTATASFNTGTINAITSQSYDLSSNPLKKNMRCAKYPSCRYEFLALNNNRKFFAKAEVRSAISTAINREKIAADCYYSFAEPANVPVHPLSKLATPSPVYSEYNLESAWEMLFYEGYSINKNTGLLESVSKETPKIEIIVNKENNFRCKCGEQIAQDLIHAGIDVTLKKLDFEKYISRIETSDFDAYIGGVELGNAYDFEVLFSQNGKLNNFGFSSEPISKALEKISVSPSKTSMENALLNFEEAFIKEQPVCGIAFLTDAVIATEATTGRLLPSPGFPYANISQWKAKEK